MAARRATPKAAPPEAVQQAPVGRFLLIELRPDLPYADQRQVWHEVMASPYVYSCRDLALCDLQTLNERVLLQLP